MILVLWKVCQNSTEFPYTLHSISPNVDSFTDLLHNDQNREIHIDRMLLLIRRS